MDYEKAYKEAFERAKQVHASSVDENKKSAEYIFPVLKESEDERVRKELIDAVQGLWDDDALPMPLSVKRKNEWLAWLEKQGEEVDVIESFDTEFEKQVSRLLASILRKDYEYTEDFVKWVSSNLLGYAKYELGKQDEQKPAWSEEDENHIIGITQIIACAIKHNVVSQKTGEMEISWLKSLRPQNTEKPQGKSALEAIDEKPADKIEPRFKVGDWVVANYSGKIGQVVAVSEDGYGYQLDDGLCFGVSWCDIFHLWCIKDARDGDVLASDSSVFIFQKEYIAGKPTAYCGIVEGNFCQGSGGCWTNEQCHPATKEQWNTLRSKMKEAGYEWDSEKKELKEYE